MYKGKDFGTPLKKMGYGVCCLVAFEIRSGSYLVSPAKPGEKFAATFCRTYYMLRTTYSCIQYVVPPKGVRHIDALTTIYLTRNNQQLFVLVQMLLRLKCNLVLML